MDFKLSHKDVEWLATQHPGLNTKRDKKLIEGDIFVERSYNGVPLSGTFPIKIELKHRPNTILPKVYIVSKKLKNIAVKLNINMLDIHVNHDQSICMVISEKEHECFKEGFTIEEFFENCLEPYLFWVSYCEKFGKPPWKEYAHGSLGFMELYAENRLTFREVQQKVSLREISKYIYHYDYIKDKCLCGKNKDMKKCHRDIYYGLKKFKGNWNLARVS